MQERESNVTRKQSQGVDPICLIIIGPVDVMSGKGESVDSSQSSSISLEDDDDKGDTMSDRDGDTTAATSCVSMNPPLGFSSTQSTSTSTAQSSKTQTSSQHGEQEAQIAPIINAPDVVDMNTNTKQDTRDDARQIARTKSDLDGDLQWKYGKPLQEQQHDQPPKTIRRRLEVTPQFGPNTRSFTHTGRGNKILSYWDIPKQLKIKDEIDVKDTNEDKREKKKI